MKKYYVYLPVICVVLLLAFLYGGQAAFAEEARNIAPDLQYKAPDSKNIPKLYDGDYDRNFHSGQKRNKYIEISSEEDIHSLYIRWMDLPRKWEIQVKEDGEWKTLLVQDGMQYHSEVVKLPGLRHFRMVSVDIELLRFTIFELEAYTEGVLPAHVQLWETNEAKKDIMLLIAHPDDEYLFFGGLIPTYANQPNRDIQVVYMTTGIRERIYELLDGLWHTGLRNYPTIGRFDDSYSTKRKDIIKQWKEPKALAFLVDEIRKHKPDVLVTHDIEGEYGHGAHKATAELARQAFFLAADPSFKTEREPWRVSKLYYHLGDSNTIQIDWELPMQEFGGKTSLEVAAEAFGFHRSQQGGSASYKGQKFMFEVVAGGIFDNGRFSLVESAVGEDRAKNDFFENLQRVD